MRDLIRAGVQLPFFTMSGADPGDVYDRTAAVAKSADDEGFDALFVMDHFFQLPFLGGPAEPMLEGYTLLSALATCTSRVRLGTLVTGVTYRNPALLAKMLTTLDVISHGRALAGLGAGWYEEEHVAFGYEFPGVARRFEMLTDAIGVLDAMFSGNGTYSGTTASVVEAHNVPAPVSADGPPLLLGGAGERRTLPLAARSAAASNLNCTVGEVPHKVAVLNSELERVGRARDDINVTLLCSMVCADDDAGADAALRRLVVQRGMPESALDDPGVKEMLLSRMLVGGVDTVAEQMSAMCGDDGLDGFVVMLPSSVGDPEGPAMAARAFRAAGLME